MEATVGCKQKVRIKGINFNYDLPAQLFIVGLDKNGVPEIQKVNVTGITKDKLLTLKQMIRVKPVSKMHWDAIHKHSGTWTIPHKSLSDNPDRGYVFKTERLAIARIAHLRDSLSTQVDLVLNQVALIAARHDRYLQEYYKKKG